MLRRAGGGARRSLRAAPCPPPSAARTRRLSARAPPSPFALARARVFVVGDTIAGRLLQYALAAKAGKKVEVAAQRSRSPSDAAAAAASPLSLPPSVGAAADRPVLLPANAVYMLEQLGALPRVRAAAHPVEWHGVHDDRGAAIARISLKGHAELRFFGHTPLALSAAALARAIDGACTDRDVPRAVRSLRKIARAAAEVRGDPAPVALSFAGSGREARADVAVGVDGRARLVQGALRRRGGGEYAAVRGGVRVSVAEALVPMPPELQSALDRTLLEFWGNGCVVQLMAVAGPADGGAAGRLAVVVKSRGGGVAPTAPADVARAMRAALEPFTARPVALAAAALRERASGAAFHHCEPANEYLASWSGPGALVIADEAHPLLPVYGQDVALGIEDALTLVHFLSASDGGTLEQRKAAFLQERTGRVAAVQAEATKLMRALVGRTYRSYTWPLRRLFLRVRYCPPLFVRVLNKLNGRVGAEQ